MKRPMVQGWAARIEALSSRRLVLLLIGLFALAHSTYYLLGVRFDDLSLPFGVHVLDPEFLRHRLAESLFYLHSQPPLFNLFLGLIVKLFPGHELVAFQFCYLAAGLALYLVLFALLRSLALSRALALGLSTWFMVSPSFVLYEHWLFYTLPMAALLALSALLFHRVIDQARAWQAAAFFSVLLLICLLHSMFHLLYYAFVTGALLLLRRSSRRCILLAGGVPFLLLLSLYVKNSVLFHQFTTSSWFGMSLYSITARAMPLEERRQLVAEGELSPLVLIRRLSPLSAYPRRYLQVPGFENVPALRQVVKSTGANNYNHLAYIALSKEYLRDDLWVILHRPRAYLVGLLNAWLCYFRSSSDYPLLYGNLRRIVPVNCLYDYLFYGKVPFYRVHSSRVQIYYAPFAEPRLYVFLLAGLPALVIYGLRAGLRRDAGSPLSASQRLLVLYACFNIMFVAFVWNSVEVTENHRFRFATDPLYVLLLGLALQHSRLRHLPGRVVRRLRRRSR